MSLGTWIYERTATTPGGDGGGTTITPAPPVTITGTRVDEKQDGYFEVLAYWTKAASATSENFLGVHVYLEDPDLSVAERTPLDGRVKLNRTANLSGQWKPVAQGDSFVSPITLKIKGKTASRPVRIYALAYGKHYTGKLVRANETGETPNIQVLIPAAASSYVPGEDHTWKVTNAAVNVVEDFDNPAGPQATLEFSFTPPDDTIPLPPGLKPFGGVRIVFEYEDGTRADGPFLEVNRPETWHATYPVGSTSTYKVWFISVDVDGAMNEIIEGVTPMVPVTIVYPPEGQGPTPDVADFVLSNPRHETQMDGTRYALVDADWTIPASPRYAGVNIYRVDLQPPRLLGNFPTPLTHAILSVNDYPTTNQTWTIAAISYDFDGKPSADPTDPPLPERIPTAPWVVGPPGPGGTGQEYTGLGGVSSAVVETEQKLGNDGVVMMRHKISGWTNPTMNSFGGMSIARVITGTMNDAPDNASGPKFWDAAKGETTLLTDWEPAPTARTWDFYFVSRDMEGKRNSILAGATPKVTHAYTPIENAIIASRLPEGWWNPAEFEWPDYPDGQFQALNFVAKKIFVGSILRVGGGPTTESGQFGGFQNGQIAVYNSANVIRAWMGEHTGDPTPDNGTPHTIYGGWFAELYIGGSGPDTAPIYCTQAGTVIVGGWDVKTVAGVTRYPYISIRRNDGVEVGRIGARIGEGLVASSDPAYIGGGWFKELAVGGANLSDWRILARRDPTNPAGADLFNIRNVNKFTIDYQANYNPPGTTNPTNAPVTLQFGFDAFIADSTSSLFWKFPGLTINRTNAANPHGLTIFNRGILGKGPDGLRKFALVSFNGDSTGNDGAAGTYFWSEFLMYDAAGNINVKLCSGKAGDTGGSYFELYTQGQGTPNFKVDSAGNASIRGTLSMGGLSVTGNLSVSGNGTFGGAVQAVGVNALSGQLSGASVNVPGGNVGCNTVTADGLVRGGTLGITGRTIVNASGEVTAVQLYIAGFGAPAIESSGNYNGAAINMSGNISTSAGVFVNKGFNGVTGPSTFTTADGKTVTVRGGIITSIA